MAKLIEVIKIFERLLGIAANSRDEMHGDCNGQSDEQLGDLLPLAQSLREEIGHISTLELRPCLSVNHNSKCFISSIEVRPLDESAKKVLDKFRSAISAPQFITGWVITPDPLGTYFELREDFSFKLKKSTPSVSSSTEAIREVIKEIGLLKQFECKIYHEILVPPDPELIEFTVKDSIHQGGRIEEIDRFQHIGEGNALLIGRGQIEGIDINSKFTSREHGKLWFDENHCWYSDVNARYGTLIIQYGKAVPVCGKITIKQDDELVFGNDRHRDTRDFGRLIFGQRADIGCEETPVIPPNPDYSPVDDAMHPTKSPTEPPASRTSRTGKVSGVSVFTAAVFVKIHGDLLIEAPIKRYPSRIGLGPDHRFADVVLPKDFKSVSKLHLTLLQAEKQGVRIQINGQNGIKFRGSRHGSGDSILLIPWKEIIILGDPAENEPICEISFIHR